MKTLILLQVSQASWAENAYKSNNLGVPDKAQVATRLTQIRDYVSQTESLMEGLRTAGGQVSLEEKSFMKAKEHYYTVVSQSYVTKWTQFDVHIIFMCMNEQSESNLSLESMLPNHNATH